MLKATKPFFTLFWEMEYCNVDNVSDKETIKAIFRFYCYYKYS